MITTHFLMLLSASEPAADLYPVTLAEAKAHLRVDGTDQDALITGLISQAADQIERDTGLALRARSHSQVVNDWGNGRITVLRRPLNSVTTIAYDAEDGTEGALAAEQYRVREFLGMPNIIPAKDVTWPTLESINGAVRVTLNAGLANNDAVPPALKRAALLLIGHWFEHREGVTMKQTAMLEQGYASLIAPHRVLQVA